MFGVRRVSVRFWSGDVGLRCCLKWHWNISAARLSDEGLILKLSLEAKSYVKPYLEAHGT